MGEYCYFVGNDSGFIEPWKLSLAAGSQAEIISVIPAVSDSLRSGFGLFQIVSNTVYTHASASQFSKFDLSNGADYSIWTGTKWQEAGNRNF